MPGRAYDSTRRRQTAAATRADVLAAAIRLFSERGWARTSMRDIAKEARVSVETIYSSIGSKGDVLRAVIDVSVLGDEEPVALEDRPEFRAMADGSPTERAHAAADLISTIMPRTAPIVRVIEQGAAADPALEELWQWGMKQQREGWRRALTLVLDDEPTGHQIDVAHAVLGERVYLQLTGFAQWTNEAYRSWVADTLLQLFLREERP